MMPEVLSLVVGLLNSNKNKDLFVKKFMKQVLCLTNKLIFQMFLKRFQSLPKGPYNKILIF